MKIAHLTLTFGIRNITDNDGWCPTGDAIDGNNPVEAEHCGAGYGYDHEAAKAAGRRRE